jgi:hypothetical protein
MLLSVVSALQSAAVDLERSSGGFDPGVMDADGAYSLTLNIVAEALRGISSKLQIDAQRDAAGNEEAVERRVVESDIAHSANLEGPREALDSWVADRVTGAGIPLSSNAPILSKHRVSLLFLL